MNGVIEEKSSKVLEVMVSSVRPFELMMGKILGIAAVAITQFSLWVVIALSLGTLVINNMLPDEMLQAAQGLSTDGSMEVLGSDMAITRALGLMMNMGYIVKLLVGFLVLFVGGYLLYASFFAAVGASINSQEDSSQFITPVVLIMVFGLYAAMGSAENTDGPLAFYASLFPLTSPIVMMVRIPFGVPLWEEVLSLVLLYATALFVVWISGRIYRIGILMYGKKPTVKELIKWIRL
jgi:ABC-2 type transport system permease protein